MQDYSTVGCSLGGILFSCRRLFCTRLSIEDCLGDLLHVYIYTAKVQAVA